MKTLHGYLLRQVIATLLMTALIFTFVLLLVNGLREMLPLLGKVSPWIVLKGFALLIPFLWSFALPMGLLTATLMVFGRFSADHELTAARAGGVSLMALVWPLLLFSLLLCGVSLAVNLEIAPRCRVAYVQLRDSSRLQVLSTFQLPVGQPVKRMERNNGYVIWIGKNDGGVVQNLEDVRIFQYKDETNLEMSVRAERGRFEVDQTNQLAVLSLFEAKTVMVANDMSASGGTVKITFDLGNTPTGIVREPSLSDMTFGQLRNKLRLLESAANLSIPTNHLSAVEIKSKKERWQQQFRELGEPARVQLHRQVAFSFACFGFTLVGIPLGIRVHRRETNIGIAIALGLVALYFALLIVGNALSGRPEFAPHLLMWAPNFLFQTVGTVLLWRANRGGV